MNINLISLMQHMGPSLFLIIGTLMLTVGNLQRRALRRTPAGL